MFIPVVKHVVIFTAEHIVIVTTTTHTIHAPSLFDGAINAKFVQNVMKAYKKSACFGCTKTAVYSGCVNIYHGSRGSSQATSVPHRITGV